MEPNIEYKKYDSESIVGPLDASNGKQYMQVLFIENDTEQGGYSGQSRAHTKTFFEDTHSLQFSRAEKCLETEGKLKVIGAYVHSEVDPYFVKAKDGKKIGQDAEKVVSASNPPRIGRKLTFFLLKDEDFMTERRRAIKKLEFTEEQEPIDTEKEKAEALAGGTSKK